MEERKSRIDNVSQLQIKIAADLQKGVCKPGSEPGGVKKNFFGAPYA